MFSLIAANPLFDILCIIFVHHLAPIPLLKRTSKLSPIVDGTYLRHLAIEPDVRHLK